MTESINNEIPPKIGAMADVVLQHNTPSSLVKASELAAFAADVERGTDVKAPTEDAEWLNLYISYVWGYAAIYAISTTIAGTPILLQKRKRNEVDEGWEDVVDDPSLRLLKHPNDQMSGYDLLESMGVYLECVGRNYWEAVYETVEKQVNGAAVTARRQPAELWPVRPDHIAPKRDKKGHAINTWVFQTKPHAKKKFLRKEQIVPVWYFNPFEPKPVHGHTGLRAAREDILQDQYMSAWNTDFFQTGMTPEGVLSTDKSVSPKEMNDLGKQVKQFLRGEGRKILIVGKGFQYQQVSVDPKDVGFGEGRERNMNAVLSSLGVPPAVVGVLTNAKYDNYYLQLDCFNQYTICPKLKKIEDSLTTWYLPLWPHIQQDEQHEYRLIFDRTELLAENEDKLTERLISQIEHGIRTPYQAQLELGLEGDKSMDFYMMKTTLQPVDMIRPEDMYEEEKTRRLAEMEDEIKDIVPDSDGDINKG